VRPVVADDYFGFRFSVLSQNFEPAFKLFLDTMRAPNFNKEAIDRQKEIQKAEMLLRRISDAYPRDLVKRELFGDFSYALPPVGTEAGLAAVTPESLKSWYEAYVRNRTPVVVVIGDTKGTSLASIFVRNFSGSRFQSAKLTQKFAKPVEKGHSGDQNWDRKESLIFVGFQAPPEDDEDASAVSVLQDFVETREGFPTAER